MKDEVLINISPLSANYPGSLPSIINLSQYRSSSKIPLYTTKTNNETVVGSLESGEFDFQIVAGDDDIVGKTYENAVAGFDKKNPKGDPINNCNITKILRNSLFDRYVIFEIPDYSQLSMSTYYRDFVPHVYLSGYKIWQKYITIIKYYTAKKAYILVMKKNNLGDKESTDFENINNNTIIRICYKNAKEDYNLLATHYCKMQTNPIDTNKLTGNNPYTLYSTSFIFDGKLNGDIISDYDYFYKNEKDEYIQINPELIDKVELKDKKANRTLYSQKNYFRQVAGIDISTDKPNFYNNGTWNSTDFEREVSVEININLKGDPGYAGIYLKSKYNNPKAIYKKYLADTKKYEKFSDAELKKYNSIEYNLFNKNGKRITEIDNSTNNDNDDNIEVIPEYSSKRKIVLRNSGSDLVSTLNKYVPIYRSNLKNGEILVYDSNGLFKGTTIEEGSTLIIYDNNEEENKTAIITGNNIDFDINKNSNNLLTGIEIKSNDESIVTNEFTSAKPISTFLLKLKYKKDSTIEYITAPKAYIICRCFPIPLDHYYIAKDLVYYKLPDYFYAPKNLYNRTEEYGEYNKETGENLNKFILDSIEPIIYFDSNVSGCIFYNLNNTNIDIYNNDKNETLGNCHVINYDERYIKN